MVNQAIKSSRESSCMETSNKYTIARYVDDTVFIVEGGMEAIGNLTRPSHKFSFASKTRH